MIRRLVYLLGILALGVSSRASGQVLGSVDMGAGTYHPDRSLAGGVASVAPSLEIGVGRLRLAGSGVYTDAPGGRWNFQGNSSARLRTPRLGFLRGEFLGEVDWTWHHRVDGSTTVGGEVRAYLSPSSSSVLWIGRGLGKAWTLNQGRPLGRTLVGGSARLGPVRLGLSVTSTTFDLMRGGSLTDRAAGDTTFVLADTLRRELHTDFTDAIVSGHWELASIGFDLSVGRRFSRTTPEITVWGASAMRSLGPQLGLVIAAGRAGSDPVTALPGSRYLVAGLRLTLGGPGSASRTEVPRASHAARFRIGPSRLTGREIRLNAPGATMVELAGDFTDWRPVALESVTQGDWRVVLPIAPGLHRVAIRIDGGEWQAPPDTRAIVSEFGSRIGEVVIE
jgi:hypothetical protein